MSRRRFDRERDRSRSPQNSRFASSPPRQTSEASSCKIVIRGLPSDYGWAKIKDLFRDQVGFTGYLEMVDRGVGVMEFRSGDGASKAISVMDGYKLDDGSKLRVHEETARDREEFSRHSSNQQFSRRSRNERNEMSGMSNFGNGGARYNGNMYPDSIMSSRNVGMRMGMGMNVGMRFPLSRQDMRDDFTDDFNCLNPQVLSYLGIDGPLTNQVFVWNLDFSVTWQKLKDVFRLAGNVLNVDIKESREGSPRGNAVVTFEHPFEAVQSISMLNNQLLMDRHMRVRLDRDARPGNASAEQFLSRRDNRRHDIGLANGRLPRDLASVGLTLKELASKLMMSGSGAVGGNVLPNFGLMGAMGSMPSNGNNSNSNMGPMSGNMNLAANLGNMGGMPHMGDLSSLRGGDGNYMRQMASMNVAGFRGGGYGGGQTRQVMVKNLPLNFGWKELKRIVREAGDVRYADVLYDSNQHSTGLGTVRFSTPEDAERAVRKLDGMVLDGRTIRAELDFKD